MAIPRWNTAPLPGGRIDTAEFERAIHRPKGFAEQLERTRTLVHHGCPFERREQPVENPGSLDDRIGRQLVHVDPPLGEDRGDIVRVGLDERLSQRWMVSWLAQGFAPVSRLSEDTAYHRRHEHEGAHSMRKVFLLIAVLAVILAGCRVETNIVLDIEEDGSALVGAEVGYDEEFAQLLEQSGADPDDLFGDLPVETGDDVVTIERTEGDMTYTGLLSEVDDLSTFAPDSAELEGFTSFSYTFDDDGAELAATISADDANLGGDELGEFGFDPSQLTDEFFSANVVVTMPGDVTEHNADVVRSDGTLVWKIPLAGTAQINATSSFGTSSANLLLILLVGLLLIGVIAVVAATIVSRRQSQQAVATAAASSDAASSTTEPGDTESSTPGASATAAPPADAEDATTSSAPDSDDPGEPDGAATAAAAAANAADEEADDDGAPEEGHQGGSSPSDTSPDQAADQGADQAAGEGEEDETSA